MSFAEAWTAAKAQPVDEDALDTLARAAIEEWEEERALEMIASAARQSNSARLWHWTGTLQRSLDDHLEAFASFREASRLDPASQLIAHALARTSFEAGWDSVDWFEKAERLGPPSSGILLGKAAARFAIGEGTTAADEIDRILEQVPHWFDGHRQLAQLRAVLGEKDRATESIERALRVRPDDAALWFLLLDQNIAASEFDQLDSNVRGARATGLSNRLDSYEAIAAGELGDGERADRLFASPRSPPVWHVRHLLRTGRAADALPIIDSVLAGPDATSAWPYAMTAWRAVDDERYRWLIGESGFVRSFDLSSDLPPLDRLADLVRSLHHASGEYLDQSVRGGTQTDGPLLSRTEPEIRQLRVAIMRAVESYVAALPEPEPNHPLLGPRRDRKPRFAGSWSVRLRETGFHESHVHSHGWISSALYLVLPDVGDGAARDRGTLELGAPPSGFNLKQPPLHEIEPEVGRLVLFPSWMWHGTRPFAAGERMTVAFDVKRPV
jgi:tetratricopeptide (TPR) repeat protein